MMKITVEEIPEDCDGIQWYRCYGWLSYDDRKPINQSKMVDDYKDKLTNVTKNFIKEHQYWTKKIKHKYLKQRLVLWFKGLWKNLNTEKESLSRQMEYETFSSFGEPLELEDQKYFIKRYQLRKNGVQTHLFTKHELKNAHVLVRFPLNPLSNTMPCIGPNDNWRTRKNED